MSDDTRYSPLTRRTPLKRMLERQAERNRTAGLCECGNEPEAGGMCGPCMEAERADELYHAQW